MSTRERRHQPRLIVHTGQGKGKSTAAFGLGLRAWAQGWSIGVYQFIKSGTWPTGERAAYAALHEHHLRTGEGGPIAWHVMGAGWTWLRATAGLDQAALAREGWQHVSAALAEQRHRLYLLDEFAGVLAHGWLDVDQVVDVLRAREGHQHIVITGRGAPEALLEAADLVTDMSKVKHPFDSGSRGQAGIEW